MSVGQIIAGALGVLVSLLVGLLGLVIVIRGAASARNAYVALLRDETAPGDVDAEEDTATVKLSGTVESVPEPVETATGEEAAIYNLKAVVKNQRNRAKKRKDSKWLLAEGVQLDRAVVAGDDGRFELTAEPVDEDREWGGVQEDTATGYGTLVARTDLATGEWTRRHKYTDNHEVPDLVLAYLAEEYDADLEVDVSKLGVGLTVADAVIAEGDTVRVAGTVEPERPTATSETAAVADGGAAPVRFNLTPGATVTGGSWWTLAWAELKTAALLPFGLVLVAFMVAGPLLILAQLGVISLGLGL